MEKLMKKLLWLVTLLPILIGCGINQTDSKVASRNLSQAADMFEITRRTVFYNGITGEWMLELVGRCSIKDEGKQLEVTCKVSEDAYKKHFLGLSDNVTYFVEQLEIADVSIYNYRVIFKPSTIIPDIDLDLGFDTRSQEKS